MQHNRDKLLNALTISDGEYQQLLALCNNLEPQYQKLLAQLTAPDRDLLERYISLCEELECRRTYLALELS